jgi:hypothetical protein
MKISDKFTDYGLIGGFFWALQVALVVSFGFGSVKSINWGEFGKAVARIPSGVVSPLAAVLGAVVLIAIFTTGLLLDLCGSTLYFFAEMTTFQKHARHNDLWVGKLVNQHQDYIQNDWELILSAPSLLSFSWKALLISFKALLFWHKRFRDEYVDAARQSWALRPAYTRVQTFLLAYVQLSPRAEKLDLLSTQISLWNTSRAISTAMLLVAVEPLLLYGWRATFDDVGLGSATLSYAMYLGMLLITWLITTAAFNRVCSTVFALAYIAREGSKNPI